MGVEEEKEMNENRLEINAGVVFLVCQPRLLLKRARILLAFTSSTPIKVDQPDVMFLL